MPGGGRGRPRFTSGAMGVLQHLCGLLLHMCLYLLAASVTLSHARASPRLWLGSGLRSGSAFGPGSGSGSVGAPAEALRRVLLGAKATHQRVRPELRLLVCTAEYFGLLPHWMSRSGRRSGHAHTQFLEPLPWEIVESGFSWGASPRSSLHAGEYSSLKEQGHAPHAAEVEPNTSWSKAEEQFAGQPSFSQQEAHSLVKRLDAEAVISHVSVGSPVFVLHVLEEATRAALAAWQEGVAAAVAAAARTPAPTPLHQKQEREPSLPRVALEAARAALRAATRALWRARLRRGDEAEAAAAAPGAAAEARVAALRAALRAWSRSPSGRAAQWLLRQLMADPLMRCARAYVTARLWQWAGA